MLNESRCQVKAKNYEFMTLNKVKGRVELKLFLGLKFFSMIVPQIVSFYNFPVKTTKPSTHSQPKK
ncbi:CLUMA_CG005951, isoform A [Clunio marinus]|uniref:CLUMA_CG005951, isoform A n=1 Tax=Clunio marinus TaxID=568069 RepID=A0A1J1I0N3_9DIPT|nr:CLUMA_CG005951, isoform A [Clunio marinus]